MIKKHVEKILTITQVIKSHKSGKEAMARVFHFYFNANENIHGSDQIKPLYYIQHNSKRLLPQCCEGRMRHLYVLLNVSLWFNIIASVTCRI